MSKLNMLMNMNFKDVAQLVLTKCTNTNAKEGTISQDSKDYAVTFSYEFIEDSQDIKE